jgi:hypothetical protein
MRSSKMKPHREHWAPAKIGGSSQLHVGSHWPPTHRPRSGPLEQEIRKPLWKNGRHTSPVKRKQLSISDRTEECTGEMSVAPLHKMKSGVHELQQNKSRSMNQIGPVNSGEREPRLSSHGQHGSSVSTVPPNKDTRRRKPGWWH